MNEVTTPGKILFKASVPEQFQKDTEELDKKKLSALLYRIAKEDPDAYIDSLHNIGKVAADAVTYYGGVGSISLKDFQTPPALLKLRMQHKAEVNKIINNPRLNDEQKRQSIIKYLLPEMEKVQNMLKEQDDSNNGLIRQLKTGAKGNPSQIMQLMYGDMLVVDSKGKPIPIAGLTSYGEGAGTKEYWAGSYGSRMGYASVQFATGESGYFGKLLTQGAHRVVVTEDDCGADDVGVRQNGDDPHNVGSILVRPVGDLQPGHIIEKKDLAKLKDKDVYVRSSMTCQAEEGICSKCAGHRETGDFPPIGTAVGITAARAIAEPTTQMALSSKHTGGVAGQDEKKVTGFKEVAQFVNVPENFVGGATISEEAGTVSRIEKAPQGGSYVTVAKHQHYIPQGVKLAVKQGDTVEAGDVLSEGIPNPAKIVQHKGIGEGRRYFAEKYAEILKNNGAGNHRRNIEAVSRGLINRVKITEPEGYNGYYMGDVVPFDVLTRGYEPRKGFTVKTPVASKGMYLEKPALHYTIGTKVTGSVAKNLSNAGIKSIVVHKDQVPFEPVMPRVMDIPGSDQDWRVRLGGFNLKRTFLDAATKGSTSDTGDTSYIPSVVKGEKIYSDYTEDNK